MTSFMDRLKANKESSGPDLSQERVKNTTLGQIETSPGLEKVPGFDIQPVLSNAVVVDIPVPVILKPDAAKAEAALCVFEAKRLPMIVMKDGSKIRPEKGFYYAMNSAALALMKEYEARKQITLVKVEER